MPVNVTPGMIPMHGVQISENKNKKNRAFIRENNNLSCCNDKQLNESILVMETHNSRIYR